MTLGTPPAISGEEDVSKKLENLEAKLLEISHRTGVKNISIHPIKLSDYDQLEANLPMIEEALQSMKPEDKEEFNQNKITIMLCDHDATAYLSGPVLEIRHNVRGKEGILRQIDEDLAEYRRAEGRIALQEDAPAPAPAEHADSQQKIEKKTYSNCVEEGTFDQKTGQLIEGKRTYSNGVEEGIFDPETGRLVKGKRVYSSGDVEEGIFDPETGRHTEGKRVYSSGDVEEGIFDPETERLVKGKSTYGGGGAEEGTFDRETGELVEGKRTFQDGSSETIENGFTHRVSEEDQQPTVPAPAEAETTDGPETSKKETIYGSKYEGTFDKKTGRITEGKINHADGRTEEGTFETETGKLIRGTITHADGRIEKVGEGPTVQPNSPTPVQRMTRGKVGKIIAGGALIAATAVGGMYGVRQGYSRYEKQEITQQVDEIPKGTIRVPKSIDEGIDKGLIRITNDGVKPGRGWKWTHKDISKFAENDMEQYSVTKK